MRPNIFELFGTGVDAGQTTFRIRSAWGEVRKNPDGWSGGDRRIQFSAKLNLNKKSGE